MEQLNLFDICVLEKETNGVSKLLLPLIKKGNTMLVWLWIKDYDNKYGLHSDVNYLAKFALEWDKKTNYWVEKKPFEEYGVLKGVEYMLPHNFEQIAFEYATKEVDYYSYFNSFKVLINSKNLNGKNKYKVPTCTTKQNRIPNSGLITME